MAQRPQELGGSADAGWPAPRTRGWNRVVIEVADLQAIVQRLTQSGVVFRKEIVNGPGGKQILLEDPSGNPIELFQPAA